MNNTDLNKLMDLKMYMTPEEYYQIKANIATGYHPTGTYTVLNTPEELHDVAMFNMVSDPPTNPVEPRCLTFIDGGKRIDNLTFTEVRVLMNK